MSKVLFWLYLSCALSVVIMRGDKVAKLFSLQLIVAAATTSFFIRSNGWLDSLQLVLIVDTMLLLSSLYLIGVRNKYWPIWFAAFQGISVATELALLLFPNQTPALYINQAELWSFPAIASVAIGVILDSSSMSGSPLSKKNQMGQ